MSVFRNLAWFTKGMREYTKSGFESAASHFDQSDLADVRLDNRRILVTGANSGLGLACCKELAKRGAEIHMVCRNKNRAQEAQQEIIETSGDSKSRVFIHILDMSAPRDVYAFAKEFVHHNSCLDILVNNAGCMINERKIDADGLESNFATNVLGTYILTETLLPALGKSSDARVITVSSGGMLVQKLDHADPMLTRQTTKFDGTMVYAQQKRQQVVLSEMWAEKYSNIFFCSMHPGWADTPAVALSMPSFYHRMQSRLRTAEQGADTIIWLATVQNIKKYPSGSFYQDRKVVSKHLTLANTHSSIYEKQHFMSNLAAIAAPFMK